MATRSLSERIWNREWARRNRRENREAYNAYQREWRRKNRERHQGYQRAWYEQKSADAATVEPETEGEQRCTLCRKTLPLTAFYVARTKAHGRRSRCKECERSRKAKRPAAKK